MKWPTVMSFLSTSVFFYDESRDGTIYQDIGDINSNYNSLCKDECNIIYSDFGYGLWGWNTPLISRQDPPRVIKNEVPLELWRKFIDRLID